MRDRTGSSLIELLITLVVMSVILGLVAATALAGLRGFRTVGDRGRVHANAREAVDIAARHLEGVAASDGGITLHLDSSIQIHAAVGHSFACDSGTGVVTIVAHDTTPESLGWFQSEPRAGDRVRLLPDDSSSTWLTLILSERADASYCSAFPTHPAWRVKFAQPFPVPRGSALVFARPARLSLYRSSDTRWYLGLRDWNDETQSLNTIQPVAGPLLPYDADPSRSGLSFTYQDETGATTSAADLIRTVTVRARGTIGLLVDSASRLVYVP